VFVFVELLGAFVVVMGVAWVVLALRGDPLLRIDPRVGAASHSCVPLKQAIVHRQGIAKMVKGGASDAAGLVPDADRILGMMADLVERRALLADIEEDSGSSEAAEEVDRIDASLVRSEARLRAALNHLVGERTEEVRADLADSGEELEQELSARREIRAAERLT